MVTCDEDSSTCFIVLNATDPDDPNNGTDIVFEINQLPVGSMFSGNFLIPTPPPVPRLPPSTNVTGWPMRWVPPTNFTTSTVDNPNNPVPQYVYYKVRDAINYYRDGQLLSVQLFTRAINDAPYAAFEQVVRGASIEQTTNRVLTSAVLNNYTMFDPDSGDNAIFNVSIDSTRCSNITWNNQALLQNVLGYTATACSMRFRATKPTINALFASGLTYWPAGTAPAFGRVFIRVDDNGFWGQEASPVNKFVNTSILMNIDSVNNGQIFGQSAQVGSAIAGGTTVISAGIYGLYRLMKRKKLLPEDADPWETDEFFDKTLDNPLFSGTPTTSSAANVTLVTNDI